MSDQVPQSIRKLPAARGLAWVSGSWELVKRQPLRLLLISLFFQILLIYSRMGPLSLVVILCLPVLSSGMLQAFFLVEHGEKPMLAVLFKTFTVKGSIGSLLLLGGIALAIPLLAVAFTLAGQIMDIDPNIVVRLEQGDLDALQQIDPLVLQSAVLAMAIGIAISGCITYFAVPLIWFRKDGVGSALIMGLKALGRNWKPLLVIGLFLGLMAVPIVLLSGSFYLSALKTGTASTLLSCLLLVVGSMYQLLVFGTQYLAFRDIFGLDEAAVPAKASDQLVA